MTTPPAETATMYWIRSQRESKTPNPRHAGDNERYDLAAARAGLVIRPISADDVVVGTRHGSPAVAVAGERVDPRRAFFHTKLMSWPVDRPDSMRHLTTYAALDAAGFFTTTPAFHSVINNDKLLTCLRDLGPGVKRIPTLRISPRALRSSAKRLGCEALAAAGLTFPVIVKPAAWGAGNSVFVANDLSRLTEVLKLAEPARLSLVVQPWLGREAADYRVFCLDGEPLEALARRPLGDAVAGNVGQGGHAQLEPVPSALRAPARAVAKAIGLPYLCADFLGVDGNWWFSELEIDGGTIAGDMHNTGVRFQSFRDRFDAFVRGGCVPHRWRAASAVRTAGASR